ncbi:unnamed protein product, partial [Scytosiphon promiscuus]
AVSAAFAAAAPSGEEVAHDAFERQDYPTDSCRCVIHVPLPTHVVGTGRTARSAKPRPSEGDGHGRAPLLLPAHIRRVASSCRSPVVRDFVPCAPGLIVRCSVYSRESTVGWSGLVALDRKVCFRPSCDDGRNDARELNGVLT